MRITWKKLKQKWPFIGFAISYALLFYFFGHLDAIVGKQDIKGMIFGTMFVREDLYFTILTLLFVFLLLTIFFAFLIAQKKIMTWKQFGLFILAGIVLLPNSVWGLAWKIWFRMRTEGSLTLWKIQWFHIKIPWTIYEEVQYLLTFIYIVVAILFFKWIIKKE